MIASIPILLALAAPPKSATSTGPARPGAFVLTEHSLGVGGALDNRYFYVPGLAAGWIFAQGARWQISAGASLDFMLDRGEIGTGSVRADCGTPCPAWTRNQLRVQAEARAGPAWRAIWLYMRVRAGYLHHFVDVNGFPGQKNHSFPGGTANIGLGIAVYVVRGLTLGFEAGGGVNIYGKEYSGAAGVGQFGAHLGWTFGRGAK